MCDGEGAVDDALVVFVLVLCVVDSHTMPVRDVKVQGRSFHDAVVVTYDIQFSFPPLLFGSLPPRPQRQSDCTATHMPAVPPLKKILPKPPSSEPTVPDFHRH